MVQITMIHFRSEPQGVLDIIEEHDGDLLADYGQSVLARIDDAGLDVLRAAGYRVRVLPEQPEVRVAGFSVDTSLDAGRSTSASAAEDALPSGRSHHVVHVVGPLHTDWKSALQRMGVVFEEKLDKQDFLVSMESHLVDDVQELDFVGSVSPYFPALKISPSLLTQELRAALPAEAALSPLGPEPSSERPAADMLEAIRSTGVPGPEPVDEEQEGNVEILLFEGESPVAVLDALRDLGVTVITSDRRRVVVFVSSPVIPDIARIPQVRRVVPHHPVALANNVATGIVRADTIRDGHGLDGEGQIVAIADTGLDTGVDDGTMLDDFAGRIVAIHALGRPGDASDIDNHGTHVAGSVLGDGALSNGQIVGVAPSAQVVVQSTMDSSRSLGGLPADLRVGLFDVARNDGAHIHTNSWEKRYSDGDYDAYAEDADDFAFNNREFLILFAAGNSAPYRVSAPGSAKNVLTVGASESERPLPTSVQFPNSPEYPPAEFPGGPVLNGLDQVADDADDVASFSCPGPADHNRRKPDVVAPGTWILSTRSSVSTADVGPDGWPGTQDEDGVFTHDEAVGMGLPGEPVFGAGDQDTPGPPANAGPNVTENYYYSSGTSMATPITAGSCALLRQYLVEQRGHTPSAALLKALIVNGAVDMGMGVPHTGQGWGRLDLPTSVTPPGSSRVQFDDSLANAVRTGDINAYDVWVTSTADPLAVTLVWRDPAGAAIQNELIVRVVEVVTGAEFVIDDIADVRNNVQKVIVDPNQVGHYRIEVEGVDVSTPVPELAGLTQARQDYALVVSGAIGFSCNPSDVVQVIDRSGSMGYSGYMEPAKERAKEMVDLLQINDRTAVVTFAASATEELGLTPVNSQDIKTDAHVVVDAISPGGTTDLREALEHGLSTLGADTGRPRAIVFISDGKHTVSTAPIDDAFLDNVAAAGANVYTIALGPASDVEVLNNIAARTGTGSVRMVESAADLHKLHEIYYDIVGAIGCGFVTHLESAQLAPGQDLEQEAAVDESTLEAFFAASWASLHAEAEFTLIAPSGAVVRPDSEGALFARGTSHAFYRVLHPEAGVWRMRLGHRGGGDAEPVAVTTAAMVDSKAEFDVSLDTSFLYRDKLLIRLKARHAGRPLVDGRAIATITYPSRSVRDLLDQYSDELAEIRLDPDALRGDNDDLDLIKLGILATEEGRAGNDIFERQTVNVELRDEGEDDTERGDGIYTAFFDPKLAGVAGDFQIHVRFETRDEKLGVVRYSKPIPVHVPAPEEAAPELVVEDIIVRHNRRWGYVIIGARIVDADGRLMTPADGVEVSMSMSSFWRPMTSGELPYYRRGGYYIWRFAERYWPGPTRLIVRVSRNGLLATQVEEVIIL